MNIPASAIEPFEPHGIPRLHLGGDVALKALNDALNHIKRLSAADIARPMWKAGIRTIIESHMHQIGADFLNIKVTGPFEAEHGPVCHVTVSFKMPGGLLRSTHNPIWHEGGFV
jgi:hypothetical protein